MAENEVVMVARKELRRLQLLHGHRTSPTLSIYIGQIWESALQKDPEGSQLKYVLEEIKELMS